MLYHILDLHFGGSVLRVVVSRSTLQRLWFSATALFLEESLNVSFTNSSTSSLQFLRVPDFASPRTLTAYFVLCLLLNPSALLTLIIWSQRVTVSSFIPSFSPILAFLNCLSRSLISFINCFSFLSLIFACFSDFFLPSYTIGDGY